MIPASDENLLGYLLDALDGPARADVEAALRADPAVRARLLALKRALAPLAADLDGPEPPAGLAERTLARLADAGRPLPKAPPVASDSAPYSGWWRRADALVAACLLLTLLGVGALALARLRDASGASALTACQNNLRQFYAALQTYRDHHGAYPNVEVQAPRNVAGMVVPILADAGVLPEAASIRCPGSGPHLGCHLALAQLQALPDDDFQTQAPLLSLCYAYSLGYRDEGGYHVPGAVLPGALTPLMADRPQSGGSLGNSPNHGVAGQNVLFADGHVRFCTTRTVGGDDFFLNRQGDVAAGLGAGDAVLGYSAARP